jgi:hypothetical protein
MLLACLTGKTINEGGEKCQTGRSRAERNGIEWAAMDSAEDSGSDLSPLNEEENRVARFGRGDTVPDVESSQREEIIRLIVKRKTIIIEVLQGRPNHQIGSAGNSSSAHRISLRARIRQIEAKSHAGKVTKGTLRLREEWRSTPWIGF